MKMAFKPIEEILKPSIAGKIVKLRGWVSRKRSHKDKIFLVIRDGSDIIQAIVKYGTKAWRDAEHLTIESSLEITGKVRKDERAPTGYELETIQIKPIKIAETYPIARDLSEEFLLDVRHLWLRSRKMTAIMKIRSKVFEAIHEFYRKRGFYEYQSPIFTPTAAEGGSTLFSVKYHDKKVFLAQTCQLYAEAGIYALEKMYCIAPSFRAEKSRTTRHLTEYWHAEAEQAWLDLAGLEKLAEDFISYICQKISKECAKELKQLGRDPKDLLKIKPPFPRITYTKALEILKKDGKGIPWGKDLRTIEERTLMKHYDKPLIISRYPKEVKAFYMPEAPDDPRTVLCIDILAPETGDEIIGGSQRSTDVDYLKKRIRAAGEKIKDYKWYLDLSRYGGIPHSGFGMGIERVIQWICKLPTIKDAIAFPRTPARCSP